MSVRVQVTGASQFRRGLELMLRAAKAQSVQLLNRVTGGVRARAKKDAPRAFGRMAQSVKSSVDRERLEGVVSVDAPYSRWVEGIDSNGAFGRRPGRWPPVEPIREWVIKRRLPQKWNTTIAGATFLVRRKIGLKGTPAQPFFFPAVAVGESEFHEGFEKIIDNAIAQIEKVTPR